MRAIVTVLGKDRVGIMSLVCALLAQHNVNILDISQTILQGDFTMVMLVDAGACDIPFAELAALLEPHFHGVEFRRVGRSSLLVWGIR